MSEARSAPRISIVTVCLNAAHAVVKTARSVAAIPYEDYEYLVVDGASTDDTVEALQKIVIPGLRVVSEKDAGIYDAMNKGIDLARGEFLWFLNAGDTIMDGRFLSGLDWMR